MAIGAPWVGTVVEGNVAGTSALNVTVDVSGATDGEVVWIIGTIGDSELGTVLPPAGWNLYTENSEGTSGGSSSRTVVFWKVKASGDGSVTISDAGNWTVSVKRQFVPISWPGVDTTTPAEGLTNVAHTTGTSYVTGTDTPTSNDRWAVGVFSSRGSTASVAWTADAALTSRAAAINTSTVFIGLLVADSNGAVTQAAHSYTSTGQTASHGLGLLMFLIPAAGGGGGGGAVMGDESALQWVPGFLRTNSALPWLSGPPGPYTRFVLPMDSGPVAAPSQVTFDATANNKGLTVSTINWLHVCTGTNLVLLVDVAVGPSAAPDSATSSVTYNGVSMTSLGKVHTNNSNVGYVERFALINPATGSNSVVVTTSATVASLVGGSMSFANANQTLGNYTTVTNFGNGTATTVTAVTPPAGSMVMGGHGAGTDFGAVGNTSRYNVSNSVATGCGNLAGSTAVGAGSNIAMTATVNASDFWASLATTIPVAAGGGGGNNFTQALNAALGFTGTDSLLTGKLTGATVTFTSSQARAVTKGVAATVAFTGAVTRQLARSLVATLSFTGSVSSAAVHHFTQALNATLSFTSSQALRTGHLVGATLSFTSSQARAARAHLSAAVSFTSSQARAVRTGLPVATLSFAGAITRRTATVRSATVSFAGSVGSAAVHHFTQAFNATVGFTGSVTTAAVHFFTQLLTATLAFTGSQSRRTAHGMAGAVGFTGADTLRTSRALAGSVGFTTADAFRTSTHLAGSVSFSGATHVRVGKLLAGGVAFTGSIATQAVHLFTQTLSATLSFTGALTTRRVVARVLSATVGFTSAQTRRAGHVVAASVAFTGTQVRSVKSHLAAVLGLSGGLGLVPTLLSALTNLRIRISGRRGTGAARGREGPTAISGREGDTLASGEEEGTQ